jgi:hypothetical protein
MEIIPDPYIVNQSRQKENLYYVPSVPNTPLLSEKGDISFNLMGTAASNRNGVEAQAAYVPVKHVGLIARYSSSKSDDDIDYVKFNGFELGAGYVNQLSHDVLFEAYAGLGKGNILNHHHTGFSKVNLYQYFLQPAIGLNNDKKTIQLGLVSRFSGVKFKITSASFDRQREPFNDDQMKKLDEKPFHIFWEPGLVFRFGWKEMLFHTSFSYSSDLSSSKLQRSKQIFSILAAFDPGIEISYFVSNNYGWHSSIFDY